MKIKVTFLILFITLLSLGCSRKMEGGVLAAEAYRFSSYDDSAAFQREAKFIDMSDQYNAIEESNGDSMSSDLTNAERKLVKYADVRIRVDNLETADTSVTGLLKKYDAYAASTNIQENANYYSLKIPSPVYDIFLTEMNGLGRLIHRSENTEDVTLRYYDLEGRLETKRELLRTFQSYLRRANNIEEILAVETRIAELQNDIDGTGMQLRNLANRVDYATIELNLLGPAAASSSQNLTFGEQVKNLFNSFGAFLSMIGLVLLGIIIYCIPIFIIAVFFFWLLFGRVGLLKKLWHIVMGKKQEN